MKKNLTIIFSVFLAMSLILISCAKKSTPTNAEESTPTPTNTTVAETPTLTPTNTTVATATPAPYNFDTDLQGWTISNYSNGSTDGDLGFVSVTQGSTQIFAGSGSAEVACAFSGTLGNTTTAKGAFIYDPATPENLTGKTITVHMYVPSSLATVDPSNPYGAKIFIKSGASWTWYDNGWTNLDTSGWITLTWDLSANPPSGADLTDVREIGVQVSKGASSPDWNGTIYFDEISW